MTGFARCSRLLLAALPVLGCAARLFAWGAGHDPVNRMALERLPAPIKAILSPDDRKAFVKQSHAPDDFTPWTEYEARKGRAIDPGDLKTLAAHGLKTPYAFHSAKGQAVNFILLHRALKDRDGGRAAFWGACLAHTFADEAACNHDPLIHYLTYAFTSGYGMKFGKAGMLDFGQLCRTPAGRALAREALGEQPPRRLGSDPQETLAEIMVHGLKANPFMTARGARIAAGFDANASAQVLDDARRALAELGAYGVRTWLEAVTTAWALIEEGKPDPLITPELLAGYRARRAKLVAERPLAADALYAPWLERQAGANTPAVGVVVEPSVRMNQGGLSFGGRLIASAILRDLHKRRIPFRVIDVRRPGHGALDAANTPVIVLCSGRLGDTGLVNALRAYANASGNILIIGGEHRGLLGPLSKALVKADPATLPVTLGYGQKNLHTIDKVRVHFSGPLAEVLGGEPFRFIHNPDTKAGWQKPKCAYRLEPAPGPGIEPLASITLDGRRQCVAGVYSKGGAARFVFVPEYLIAPYLLTDEPAFLNPAEPQLDRVGAAVLATTLRLLR